mgnify:CR=1 FL=1
MNKIFLYCDGGARGNPGPAAIGVAIYNEKNNLLAKFGKQIGSTTNNKAEYQAVIAGLEKAKEFENCKIEVYLDSQLVVNQLIGKYKIKEQDLKSLFWQVRDKIFALGGKVTFKYIPRRRNKAADLLVNKALDGKLDGEKFLG